MIRRQTLKVFLAEWKAGYLWNLSLKSMLAFKGDL
jgi:hypothetical protein